APWRPGPLCLRRFAAPDVVGCEPAGNDHGAGEPGGGADRTIASPRTGAYVCATDGGPMTTLSRRRFAKLLTLSTSAALLPHNVALADLGIVDAPLPATPERPDERYWQEVRSRFVLPRDLGFLNAA